MKSVINLTGQNSTVTSVGIGQRITFLDATNPAFLRNIQPTDAGVIVSRPGYNVFIPNSEFTKLAAEAEPNLTWPPIFYIQPSGTTVPHPDAFHFSSWAQDELSDVQGYQWAVSTNAGASYVNIASGDSHYTGQLSGTLTVFNCTGSNGNYYRNSAWNNSGTTFSNPALLTVT